jgi:Cache 3/Cache 2 fusion domain
VKAGDDYVRVSTNVPKPDGSGRAIGTVLDPTGKAIAAIKQGQAFYGEVPILGTPYITGYEPIKDGSGNVTGIYYVGYKKSATISKRGFRKRKAA